MDFSIYHMWQQMGMVAKGVVIILLIMSMYSIGVTVERLLALRKGRRQSIGYIGALQPMVGSRAGCEKRSAWISAGGAARWPASSATGSTSSSAAWKDLGPSACRTRPSSRWWSTASAARWIGQGARACQPEARSVGARDHLVVGAVRRPVRHGVRHHHRLPARWRIRARAAAAVSPRCRPVSPRRC